MKRGLTAQRHVRRGCGDLLGYRLRAIGHLFEAEDESQEWPELHAAIRAARKAYQAEGTMPTWETLAEKAGQPQ